MKVMVDKDLAVIQLRERGFDVTNDDGVVLAILEKKSDERRFKKALKEIGYIASSGYTFKRTEVNAVT